MEYQWAYSRGLSGFKGCIRQKFRSRGQVWAVDLIVKKGLNIVLRLL
jgi:hypothetical protein